MLLIERDETCKTHREAAAKRPFSTNKVAAPHTSQNLSGNLEYVLSSCNIEEKMERAWSSEEKKGVWEGERLT